MIFVIMNGNTPCATIAKTEGKWAYMLLTTSGITSDLYRGMLRRDVEACFADLGFSSFKQTGKTAQYTIYSLYWLDLKKQYL